MQTDELTTEGLRRLAELRPGPKRGTDGDSRAAQGRSGPLTTSPGLLRRPTSRCAGTFLRVLLASR